MTNNLINRVETELSQWRSQEERFSRLFPFSLSSNQALLKEKLDYYESIAVKYKGTENQDERFALKLLQQERHRVAKQLYPNLLIRLLRRLLVAPIKQQLIIRKDKKKTEQNNRTLHQQVQRTGFHDLSTKIDEQIRLGQKQFFIAISHYLNDKERIDHQLSFVKDQTGQYYFEGYNTVLYNETRPNEKRQQYYSMRQEHKINIVEAYNLLSGRCIHNSGTWLQLDLNDKDQLGNFRIKQFHSDYGYDLEKVLKQLPLKELLNNSEAVELQETLKTGSRVSVSFVKDDNEKRFYIEANPQFKSINIYDENSRKITLHAALGNKTMDAETITHKVIKQQQKSETKKKGMKAE